MSCCLESAVLDALRGLTNTPIKPENHFDQIKKGEDCVPYLVLKTAANGGLQTSSGKNPFYNIEIKAYFSDMAEGTVKAYQASVEAWMYVRGCLNLGDCGCFCIQGIPVSSVRQAVAGIVVYSVIFRGIYKPTEEY